MDISRISATEQISEIISGFTIAILLIPESIAFSFILGLPPMSGIHSTIIMSSITSIFGGCPGLISGATAAVATSLSGVTTFVGKEYIFPAVIMGGIIQIIMGLTGISKYISDIPKSVSSGFLIALAVLILLSQISNLQDEKGTWLKNDEMSYTLLLTIIATIVTIFGILLFRFKSITNSEINIPGGLLAIIILFLLTYSFKNINVQNVGTRGIVQPTLPSVQLPKATLSMMNILKTLPFSIAMAIAGLTESLLMVKETSKALKIPENSFQENMVQGICNILSGFTGGIGGCVLIGQSKFNLENGSKTRLSSISCAVFFILFVLFFGKTIEKIPMPAIIGIMIAIAIKTGDWMALYKKIDKEWITTLVTSLSGIFSGSLSLGIIIGSLVHSFI
jgi:SulP family sulfate permease